MRHEGCLGAWRIASERAEKFGIIKFIIVCDHCDELAWMTCAVKPDVKEEEKK